MAHYRNTGGSQPLPQDAGTSIVLSSIPYPRPPQHPPSTSYAIVLSQPDMAPAASSDRSLPRRPLRQPRRSRGHRLLRGQPARPGHRRHRPAHLRNRLRPATTPMRSTATAPSPPSPSAQRCRTTACRQPRSFPSMTRRSGRASIQSNILIRPHRAPMSSTRCAALSARSPLPPPVARSRSTRKIDGRACAWSRSPVLPGVTGTSATTSSQRVYAISQGN